MEHRKGEFSNGKKWTGKAYNNDNNILYELKEGKGYIKEYTLDDLLILKGQ